MTLWQEKRAEKRLLGECYQCSCPAVPGRTHCVAHAEKARVKAQAYYAANSAAIALRQRTTNRDMRRDYALRRQYGITLERFNEMLEEQGGVCHICKKPETRVDAHGVLHALAVDHNHETGAVRHLLCHRCNRVLGLMEDDADLLSAASAYLQDAAMSVTSKVLQDLGVMG